MQATFAPADVLSVTAEARALAGLYLSQGVVPDSCTDDARHVAICTVARLDFLVSWNFKHLANAHREGGFNAVNMLQGYPPVRIVPPTFLIHGHNQEEVF